jgi:glycosyltransferase involved in cell wall biosynthesis
MSQSPFVSVVIPVYNGIKTIGECLLSIKQQNYPSDKYEVIVVDNGSSDGTQHYIGDGFDWVKLIHSDSKGSGHARNAGVSAARGDLILSTDADCVTDTEWIRTIVEAFSQAPSRIAAIAGRILPYSTQTRVEKYKPTWVSQPDFDSPNTRIKYCATPNAAFRKSALLVVGGFDGDQGFDDTDLGIRLQEAGYEIGYSGRSLVKHRNPSSLKELYCHKTKYGLHSVALALKHPAVFGDPEQKGKRLQLLAQTSRRILADISIKLSLSLLSNANESPRLWPIVDATMAAAYYHGFCKGLALAKSKTAHAQND